MNILFIGNSLLLTPLRKLPNLIKNCPENDLYMKLIFIPSGKIYTYVDKFEESMVSNFVMKDRPNRIWTYIYNRPIWSQELNPDKNIKSILMERKWDVIIICGHSGNFSSWEYDKYKDYYKRFFELIRQYSDADIYWTWTFAPLYGNEFLFTKSKWKDHYTPDTYEEMIQALDEADMKICQDNNVKPFRLRTYYNEFSKLFPEYRHLMYDYIHPDKGLGEYFCTGIIYTLFLKQIYKMDIDQFHYVYNSQKYHYMDVDDDKNKYETDILCLPVNEETKKLADDLIKNIIEKDIRN